ncbi:filamentous haemagglutinin family protein [Magnetospirillum fulvum]|uniref:Filamentous hemagglutinin family N-terminal domain-containing protein n=1 Tax=Magnetospirillum fulvum TaxID=1082 RepID=A0A1H6HFQ1_MAGFU|nr:filamentous haemagglutinin family protein [Magnetospirillum fulvum]SEH32920.1 filamentous hemagglutinin family N-terminal domain-containing protein [Magnetospirillum fulvum]
MIFALPFFRSISSRRLLLAGVSAIALTAAQPTQASLRRGDASVTAPTAAAVTAIQQQQAAAAAARNTSAIMQNRVTLRRSLQAQARAALPTLVVPDVDGLATGGLEPNNPSNWTGAQAPTQTTGTNGKVEVDIKQTQQKAVLTWESFNVGSKTTLTFDQADSSYVALNRVVGAGTAPSQILGSVNAKGSVYVINQNGIVFGAGSQVNVHSLVASTANIDVNNQFLTNGLYSTQTGSTYNPSFTGAGDGTGTYAGLVRVDAGAEIATAQPASSVEGGGFVMLLGKIVENAGSISTPKGQALLAAGDNFIIRKGYGTDANTLSSTRGSEVATIGAGRVANTGIVFAQQGDITLAGRTLTQSGILLSTTSVNIRGTIHLLNSISDAAGSITLGADSVTAILPELDSSDTALNSQRDALIKASGANPLAIGQFNNLSTLADRLDLSRIEMVTGGTVAFEGGSITQAKGGQVAVSAGKRVFTADGAVIDVSGVREMVLPMSANNIKVNIQGNELRDSPIDRDSGKLQNSDVWIDVRDLILVPAGTGDYASDRYYTKGGLLEVSGYVANTAHTIGEWAAVGGTITLSAPDVVAQKGSVFDLSGGAITYAAGTINVTNLLGADGKRYDVGSAPADTLYLSVGATAYTLLHKRWGVTETFTRSLGRGAWLATTVRNEVGYTVGRDAGKLILSTPTAVFEGTIEAGIVAGSRQTDTPAVTGDGYKQTQYAAPRAGTLSIGQYNGYGRAGGYASEVVIGTVAGITEGMTATDTLARAVNTVWLDAQNLNSQHLGGVSVVTTNSIAVDAPLTLANGGKVELIAPVVDINADVTARGGSFTATNVFTPDSTQSGVTRGLLKGGRSAITLGEDVTLDLRGLWVNLQDDPAAAAKLAWLNGGSATLSSTHNVTLRSGSLIDVSSGAAILASGKTKGGKGGNVTLIADYEITDIVADGLLTLDGKVAGFGVNGGGTLKIESGTAISIGGELLETDGVLKPGETAAADLVLAQDYTIHAGDILPIDYNYSVNVALAGEAIPAGGIKPTTNFTPQANWNPPDHPNEGSEYDFLYKGQFYLDGKWYGSSNPNATSRITISNWRGHIAAINVATGLMEVIPYIPAGVTLYMSQWTSYALAGYVVPADVFPNGLPTQSWTKTAKAGTASPVDMTLRSGTLLSAGTTFANAVQVKTNTQLDTSLFQSGFSNYDVTARNGVVVTDGTKLDVTVPVYRFTSVSSSTATGADPETALDLWTPPLDLEDAAKGVLTQRAGASLTLRSVQTTGSTGTGAGGPIVIGSNATVTVDPGQSINLLGFNMRVDGGLNAWGGAITLDIPSAYASSDEGSPTPGLIWIGETAVLDVAARAATAQDSHGRTYGRVADGGSISIGGGIDWEETGEAFGPNAFVVIRPGALLDASGASAVLDTTGTPVTVASNGGSIIVKSSSGLYLDGTLRAAAGGAGAAGGTLALALISPNYQTSSTSGAVLSPREFILAQTQGDSLLPEDIDAASAPDLLKSGTARLGVDRIAAGGFDNLSLLVDGPLSFDGNVSLNLGQSLRLYTAAFALADGAASGSRVSLAAPYVRLAGVTRLARDHYTLPTVGWVNGASQQHTDALFRVDADLIDIRDTVGFGARGTDRATNLILDRRGFATVDLASTGDLRLLRGRWLKGATSANLTRLESSGNIVLTAAQVYPATDVQARIVAGYRGVNTPFVAGTSLTIRRAVQGDVAIPYSAFGKLTLAAETVNQGGIVRAPFGSLTLGSLNTSTLADSINLLAGSLTSVSGAGLVMPYGGTVDGITYSYDGSAIALSSGVTGRISSTINLNGAHVASEDGSTLDLSGGGELTGAGFVSGRGGSVDILTTPLASAGPGYGYSKAGNAVYAIVPSSGAAYAPVAADAGAGNPLVGQQITIPAGVPGLPAGTYTLMPSTYALVPGAFRVEIGAGDQTVLRGVTALGNGSYIAAGTLGIANTAIRDSLPNQVIITPAQVVRTHSSYNEMSYNAFVLADADSLGVPRAAITADAGMLAISLFRQAEDDVREALSIAGDLRLDPEAESDGYGGTVSVGGIGEVLATGQTATQGFSGVSVHADALSALDAPRLLLNASLTKIYGQTGRYAEIRGEDDLIIRSGAQITAGEIIIASSRRYENGGYIDGAITIEEGASIIAKAGGPHTFDSSDGFVFKAEGALVVSNGWFNLILSNPPTGSEAGSGVNIKIGACVTTACDSTTRLVSSGTIAIATNRVLTIADNVSYGTKNLVLGVASVNLGENAGIAAAKAAGQLPDGLLLNQEKLADLLAGNTATGAPALETLVLNARDAINVYGSVDLDASSLERVVFGTPAIYGYGAAGDVATIRAGEFIWTGAEDAPGAPVAALLGHGALDIAAKSIRFGYGPNTQQASNADDKRLALGFGAVRLTASERITASGKSALSVYETRNDYVTGEGWQYTGGDLTITSPLVTGEAGSKFTVVAGGDVVIAAPAGAATAATSNELGAQLSIAGRNVTVDTAIVLPSGQLTLNATDDLMLDDGARIDLSGREVTMLDVKKYSWGGDLILSSTGGDVTTAAGSVINLSAENNRGGTMTVTALSAGKGHVDLAGAIKGSASGHYDAGGTIVPFDAAELTVRAQTLAGFAGLNNRLNTGEVFGARRFQIKQGDLVVGDGVKAREVQIVLDGGNLTVDGTIDASGYQVGSIRLVAMGDLTVNGTLDAHGTGMRFDSYGKIIDSPNRAIIDLTSRNGSLTIGSNAAFDMRVGTSVAIGSGSGQNDGVTRGTLDLNARRLGANDVAINVIGTPAIQGAKTIAVNAFRIYDDAPLAAAPDVTGSTPQLITKGYLDIIDGHSQTFINAALGNTALGARLAGLGPYHLRPGVEITSNAVTNPNGDLTVVGDLDLSGYRYGPQSDRNNPALRGYGEPGVLVLRAAGNLTIHGSINDGFAPPSTTPDDAGWVLSEGTLPFGGDIVVPGDNLVLDTGTTFQAGVTLNYAVPVAAMTLPTGTILPVDAVLTGTMTLSAGTVVAATIYNADGSIAYAAGTVLANGVTLTAGMKLGAGTPLRSNTAIAALLWPKGVALPVQMVTTGPVALARGSLIPSTTKVELVGDASIDLRPASAGFQGSNWAVASMLGAGSTSWDMQLVAGADLASADTRARSPSRTGSIILADTHYTIKQSGGGILKGINQQGVDYLVDEIMWGWIPDNLGKSDLLGMTEAEIVSLYGAVSWDDFYSPDFWNESSGNYSVLGNLPLVRTATAPAYSVIRTGTGDLSLIATGDVRMNSLYGVYTAGTATTVAAAYDQARGVLTDGSILGIQTSDYSAALASYHAWYPDQGGNLLIVAGGNLIGDIRNSSGNQGEAASTSTSLVGDWLWRQGSGSATVDTAIPTAWWINFGTYARVDDASSSTVEPVTLVGFTGFGTLGGGDVTIRVGGDAGKIESRGSVGQGASSASRSQGLVVAVGSTGRVGVDGTLTLTGGGDLDMRIAGALNPLGEADERASKTALSGSIINLRGTTQVEAESIGEIRTIYRSSSTVANPIDPRGADPFESSSAQSLSGLVLVPGDSAVYLQTLGDMVIAGAGDATRSYQLNTSPFTVNGTDYDGGGNSWFSLWTDHTAINLISAGGNIAPSKAAVDTASGGQTLSTDLADTWPAILRVAAFGGNIYYGASAGDTIVGYTSDTLAPSLSSELSILATGSIYAGQRISNDPYESRHALIASASGTPLPTPFDPAFVGRTGWGAYDQIVSNLSDEGDAVLFTGGVTNRLSYWNGTYSLFTFGPNTAATAPTRDADAEPIRIYAVGGDIVGLGIGELINYSNAAVTAYYRSNGPLRMMAGRDIVASGMPAARASAVLGYTNLIVHSNETDVSVVSAGRDILYTNFNIAGPGTLEVSAGRNILQDDKGSITSIGPIATGDTRPGTSILMQAGIGASGPDYAAMLKYLDPANLLPAGTPLDGSGKVAKTYEKELADWLENRYGFTGTDENVRAYFGTLAPEQQRIFLRQVYFAELREGGREYNDGSSVRFLSYLRGRNVIATLFPETDAEQKPISRSGDIIMFGGSGVRTNFGGDIQMLTPGGKILVGVEGTVPPSTSGVITQGQGDIQFYSKGSILLGLSRIMTTFGGDILAWTAEGDINAGRGAKTTIIYTPPKRVYDNYGKVTLSPSVPSSGAGIATLNPIPEVPVGDIDLIAPLGTIDAGEAGIRVSGNINIAALRVLNAANIQVQGSSKGLPVVAGAPNIGTLTAASATAGQAAGAAEDAARASRQTGPRQTDLPSIITFEVVGYGGGNDDGQQQPPRQRQEEDRNRRLREQQGYDERSPFQVVGAGRLNELGEKLLTRDEIRQLQ